MPVAALPAIRVEAGGRVLEISSSEPFAEAGADAGPASLRQLQRRPRYFAETLLSEAAATLEDLIDRIEL